MNEGNPWEESVSLSNSALEVDQLELSYMTLPAARETGIHHFFFLDGSGGGGLVAKSCPALVTPWTVVCQALLSMDPVKGQDFCY